MPPASPRPDSNRQEFDSLPVANGAQRRKETEQWLRRRRLERQLHDGASLRLSALTLRMGLLDHQSTADHEEWRRGIGRIQDELHAALQELRDIAAKIYPPLLDEAGLGPALRELADQLGTDIRVTATDDRFGPAAEGAAYFALAEWLGAREPAGPPIRVTIGRQHDELVLDLTPIEPADLHHLLDHARPLGGVVFPTAEPTDHGGPITMRIPCE